MTLRATGDANVASTSLAARMADGPRLCAPELAEQKLREWLADIDPGRAAELEALFVQFAQVRRIFASIAEASPYLFDLIRHDPARTLDVLRDEPERHLERLIDRV